MYRTLSLGIIVLSCFFSVSAQQDLFPSMPNLRGGIKISASQDSNELEGITELRGGIKIKDNHEKMPRFRVLYEGKETVSNPEGFFSIPVHDGVCQTSSLIVCKDVQQNFDKTNTIKNVSITRDQNYRFFTYEHSPFGGQWTEQAQHLRMKNFVIPEHCVVVLMDAKILDGVEQWKLDLGRNILRLPILLLKADTDSKRLERVSAKSILNSLDATSFHESVREEIKKPIENAKVHVSLAR